MAKMTRQSFDYRLRDTKELYKSTSTVAFSNEKQIVGINYEDSKTKLVIDINSRLANYIDTNLDNSNSNNSNNNNNNSSPASSNHCSAIQLEGYRSIKRMTLEEFLGLGQAALLGRASIDTHHECYVYESKLTAALPLFFSPLREEKLFEPPYTSFSLYIVIYIAHRQTQPDKLQQSMQSITTFPRRIEIYKRQNQMSDKWPPKSASSTLLERVDFSGFIWKERYSVETNEEMSMLKVDDSCNLQTIQRPTQAEIIAKFPSDINTQLLINAAQRNVIDSFESLLWDKLQVPSTQISNIELQAKSGSLVYFGATIADFPSSQTKLIYIGNGPIVDGTSLELEHLTLEKEKYLTRDNCLLRASLNQNVQFVSYCYNQLPDYAISGQQGQILCLALNTARISEKVGGPCEYYSVERTYRDFVDHGNSKPQLAERLLNSGTEILQNEPLTIELDQFKQASFVRNRAFGSVASSTFFTPVEQHQILLSVSYKIISKSDRTTPTGHYFQANTATTLRQCHLLCNNQLFCNSYSYCDLPNTTGECILSDLTVLPNSSAEKTLKQTLTKFLSPVVKRTVTSVDLDGSIYTFETNPYCLLRRKDYTKLFSKSTGEVMLVENRNSHRTTLNSCAAECAANAENCLKLAYCFKFQTCYLEQQFTTTTDDYSYKSKQLNDSSSVSDDHCLIYNRKFSSLYSITKRKSMVDSEPSNSRIKFNKITVKLESNTRPESCAKSCSSDLGPNCSAFDYCQSKSKSQPDYCRFVIIVAPYSTINDTTKQQQQAFPLESHLHCDHYTKEQHTSLEWQNSSEDDELSVEASKVSYLITTISCVTFVTIAYILTYRALVVEKYTRFVDNREQFELSARG